MGDSLLPWDMQVPHLLSFRVVMGRPWRRLLLTSIGLQATLAFWLHKTRGNDMDAHNKGYVYKKVFFFMHSQYQGSVQAFAM